MSNNLNLQVGTQIKIGKEYATRFGEFKADEVITLVEGYFDYENGLYCETQTAPAIWNEDAKEFDSIYQLFGNDLEYFMDCEVLMISDRDDERSVATKDQSGN